MTVSAGAIVSEILIDIEKLEGQIRLAKKKLDTFAQGQTKAANKVEKGWTRALGAFTAAAAGFRVFGFVRDQVTSTIAIFGDYEEALITAAVKTGEAATSTEEFAKAYDTLSQAAKEAGQNTLFTAEQSAQALQLFAAAGFGAEDAVKSLNGTLALATATGSDLTKSTSAVTSVLSQFGKEFTTADQIANSFTTTITSTKADLAFLQQAFKFAGTTTSILGTSLEQTAAAMGILADAGFSGTQAGRSLRGALNDLTKEAGPTTKRLLALSDQLSFSQIDPNRNNLLEILTNIRNAGISSSDVFSVFTKEVGTQFATLLKNADKLGDLTEKLEGSNQAYDIQQKILDGLNAKQKLLTSAIQAFRIELATELAPAIKFVLDALTTFFRSLARAPKIVQLVGTALAGLATVAGALVPIIKVMGATFLTAFGPWPLIAAAIVGVVAGLVAYTGRVTEAEKQTRALKEATDEYIRELSSLTDEQLRQEKVDLTRKINKYKDAIEETSNALVDATGKSIEEFKAAQEAVAKTQARYDEYRKQLQAVIDLEKDRQDLRTKRQLEAEAQALSLVNRTAKDYQERLDKLGETKIGTLKIDKEIALQRLADIENIDKTSEAYLAAEKVIKQYYDTLIDKETELQRTQEINDTIDSVQESLEALGQIYANYYDRRIALSEKARQSELEGLEGLKEDERQLLEDELATAKATNDQKLINEAEYNLRSFDINEKYDAKREELERKKAQAEYRGSLAAWTLEGAQIASANAAGLATAFNTVTPYEWPFTKTAAIANAVASTGAWIAAKPQKPVFETGGIVPGNSYTGDKVDIGVNSGEMILNGDQQAGLFDFIRELSGGIGNLNEAVSSSSGGGTVNVIIDSRVIETVVQRGLKTQRITVPPNVVRS